MLRYVVHPKCIMWSMRHLFPHTMSLGNCTHWRICFCRLCPQKRMHLHKRSSKRLNGRRLALVVIATTISNALGLYPYSRANKGDADLY